MKKRTILLGVAVLAIGFMVLPYAMSAYVPGSHDWAYDGTWSGGDATDVDCDRCHAGCTCQVPYSIQDAGILIYIGIQQEHELGEP